MSQVKAPCYNCESRSMHCHSECESYAQYQRENARERDMIKREKAKQAAVTDYVVSSINKQKKLKNTQHLGWKTGR